jgi:cytochrome c553
MPRPSASTNPLTGLYGGWQAVENSSLALLESADLLTLSGRVLYQRQPVPVDESQWKAAVEAMRESARATAAAARARSQEQISEADEQLADSCSGCHRIYRRAENHCSR